MCFTNEAKSGYDTQPNVFFTFEESAINFQIHPDLMELIEPALFSD